MCVECYSNLGRTRRGVACCARDSLDKRESMKKTLELLGLSLIMGSLVACSVAPAQTMYTPESPIAPLFEAPDQPVAIVSVMDTYRSGQTVNPGGPEIEITLRNVSQEQVVSLDALIEERGRQYSFDFSVTSSRPLAPGRLASARRVLIGGGWGDGVTYSVNVSGTLQSGLTFSFSWKPSS